MAASTGTYVGINCKCEGFTQQDALQIDLAAGRAKQFATATQQKLGSWGPDVIAALKHHFKIDTSKARGIGTVYQDNWIQYIASVYRKMVSDFIGGMTYILGGDWNPMTWPGACSGNPAFTVRVNPKAIHLNRSFVQSGSSGNMWSWALLHEQAHFASRNSPGGFNSIADYAYFDDTKKYLRLSTDQALHNADSFTNFAKELLDPGFDWDRETAGY